MYTCNICEKSFCRKYHLERHENNKKKCVKKIHHEIIAPKIEEITQKNEEITQKNEEKMSKNEEIKENKKAGFTCEYCNREYSRKDNLNRHIEKYCRNVKNETGMLIELIHENRKILDKMQHLEEKVVTAAPPVISTTNITNNTHNTNNNIHVTNNIINFNDLNYDIDKNFMYNCLKSGLPGDIEYLRKVYLDTIPRECRPVRCLDPSRDKCMVRKNGEWIASTGKDIYRQSLKRLIDNYLRVNNSMLDENVDDFNTDFTTYCQYSNDVLSHNTDIQIDDIYMNTDDAADIDEYLNEYSIIENENTNNNSKMDEYVNNLNRITRMMEDKNVEKVSRHMNMLLK